LQVFLSLGDITSSPYEKRGVVKAQLILALHYIQNNHIGNARKIQRHLDLMIDPNSTVEEKKSIEDHRHLLISLKQELSYATPKDYWEVTERGANFAYLPIEYTEKLTQFFSWFGWYSELFKFEQEYWDSAEGQKFKLQQELNNFDRKMNEDKPKEEFSETDTETDNTDDQSSNQSKESEDEIEKKENEDDNVGKDGSSAMKEEQEATKKKNK
jgi:hypothetical protein